jgi:dTDP-4-dehydrorhamnose reductase
MTKRKRVLLTGGSGLLALNWAMHIRENCDVVLGTHTKDISLNGITSCRIHMETMDAFSSDLDEIQPDIVIHCAGLANVEVCEADPIMAYQVNVVLSENVAICCKQRGISFVYISTDHLFSGKKPLVTEEETTSPVNVYGKTKLEAEQRIMDISDKHLAIRTNFYGWGPSYRQSFSDMIIGNIRAGKAVSLFDDFFYTPILIEELAQSVMELTEKNASGIFNVTGEERISKYTFGKLIAERFDLDESLIKVARFSDRKDLVQRPGDLSLSNKKLVTFLQRSIGNVKANIEGLFEQEQNGFSTIIRSI